MLQGRLTDFIPERCSIGWHTTGAIRQWIRNLRLATFITPTLVLNPYLLDLLKIQDLALGTCCSRTRTWTQSVPSAVADGYEVGTPGALRMHPSATADGTDCVQVRSFESCGKAVI